VPAGTSRRELDRQVALSRMVRRLGARTYAPAFRRSKEWIVQALQPEGLEHLAEAKRTGGAIVLATHAGFTAWVTPVLHQLGYPLRLSQRERIVPEKAILLRWQGLTSEVLPYPESAEGGLHLKALHNLVVAGNWVQQAGDYPSRGSGLRGKYLGFEVRCVRAPWVLARLTGRPAIPILMLMDERLKLKLIVREPIYVARSGNATDATTSALQSYLDFATEHISPVPWNLNLIHLGDLFGRAVCARAAGGQATVGPNEATGHERSIQ